MRFSSIPKCTAPWKALTSLLVCRSVFTHFGPNLPIKLIFFPHDPPPPAKQNGQSVENWQTSKYSLGRSLTNCSFSSLMTPTTARALLRAKIHQPTNFPELPPVTQSRRNWEEKQAFVVDRSTRKQTQTSALTTKRRLFWCFSRSLPLSLSVCFLFLFTFATCEISRRKRKCASVSGAFDELIGSRSTHTKQSTFPNFPLNKRR